MLLFSEDFLKHEPPDSHPENPGRLHRIMSALRAQGLDGMVSTCECAGSADEIAMSVHSREYVRLVKRKLAESPTWLDEDTYLSPGSGIAIERALACSLCLARQAAEGGKLKAFLLVRPPGHHSGVNGPAMGAESLGFCIFNNAAVVAKALSHAGTVLLVDFDSHHGNGTQEIFYRDKRVVHLDVHQHPSTLYPGTGWPDQIGEGEARGTKLNIVLPPGASDDIVDDLLSRLDEYLGRFSFDFVVVSAGFDAFVNDGLANLRWSEVSYYGIGDYLRQLGRDRPVIALLEGGYTVGLERGVPAFVRGLFGLPRDSRWVSTRSDDRVWTKYHAWRQEYEGFILSP